ncbi:EscF/YscF/HrpA family type III secretion system needle major subunit [Burkholderia metallica]|uniref:EscF/YscF/HrpA family type III secretion system needle major subunit n=1 Tax=Burkholderia metallica TaxID=488729 RepID=A0ABT8PHW0_9BURK|nr:EscF/YscF/HrpA family type III secretion system needle major subunit [Burkholderia metallica]MDN7934734.1 EscF/YscF/HrpA family type III secretion system needle major subunit [Burkholderia metallica]
MRIDNMDMTNDSTRADEDVLNGFLVSIYAALEPGIGKLHKKEEELRKKMESGAISDPALLAQYQAVTSELSLARNAQSSVIKMFKDVDSTIVGNFR